MNLSIADSVTTALQHHVREWGQLDRETGAFLLNHSDSQIVDMIAWPQTAGVVRSRGQFRVSGLALARLFDWCGEHDVQIAALLHSHKKKAFLSPTDLKYGFAAEGFLSAIVPDYATPSANPARWGWWRFQDGEWVDEHSPIVRTAPFNGVSFDEDGPSSLEPDITGRSPVEAERAGSLTRLGEAE
jgi:hypothetical protein